MIGPQERIDEIQQFKAMLIEAIKQEAAENPEEAAVLGVDCSPLDETGRSAMLDELSMDDEDNEIDLSSASMIRRLCSTRSLGRDGTTRRMSTPAAGDIDVSHLISTKLTTGPNHSNRLRLIGIAILLCVMTAIRGRLRKACATMIMWVLRIVKSFQ